MSNDYIMRQIEQMATFLGSVIFARRPAGLEIVQEDGTVSSGSLVRLQVFRLLADGQVCQAEDVLFDAMRATPNDPTLAPLALDFYTALNQKSDAQLAAANFSRAEIAEGMAEAARLLGAEQLAAPQSGNPPAE